MPRGAYAKPELSPDGTRVAMERADTQGGSGSSSQIGRRAFTTVTRNPGLGEAPVWMPDGVSLVFTSRPALGAVGHLFTQRADGTGAPTQLSTAAVQQVAASTAEYAGSVLRDGAEVIYAEVATGSNGIKVIDLRPNRSGCSCRTAGPPALARPPVAGLPAARVWHRRGLRESLPERRGRQVAGLDRRRASPRWSRDGSELFFRGLGSKRSQMFALAIPAAGTLENVRPQVLFDFQELVSSADLDDFDVAADRRFLVFKRCNTEARHSSGHRELV